MSSLGEAARAPRFPVGLDLAPGPAHHVLAHRPFEQAEQGALHPPRVGPGEVDRGDQRLRLLRQPLIAAQRLRPPFRRPASLVDQPRPRHLHRLGAERADDLPLAVAVAMALAMPGRALGRALVSAAAQHRPQLLLEDRLDETAHPLPDPVFQRVERATAGQWRRGRGLGIFLHGVISLAVAAAYRCFGAPGDYAAHQFPPHLVCGNGTDSQTDPTPGRARSAGTRFSACDAGE